MKMKITEIEATAEDLRATRTLSDHFVYALASAFESVGRVCDCDDEDDEEIADMRGDE